MCGHTSLDTLTLEVQVRPRDIWECVTVRRSGGVGEGRVGSRAGAAVGQGEACVWSHVAGHNRRHDAPLEARVRPPRVAPDRRFRGYVSAAEEPERVVVDASPVWSQSGPGPTSLVPLAPGSGVDCKVSEERRRPRSAPHERGPSLRRPPPRTLPGPTEAGTGRR